jgi:hypothetical protein
MEPNDPQHVNPVSLPIQPIIPEQKTPFWKNKWILIGLGVILLMLLTSSAYYLGGRSKNQTSNIPYPMPLTESSATSPSPVNEISKWKTYENQRFSFSLKLPENFKLRQELNEDRNIEATQETALYQVVIFDSSENNMSLIINLGENSNFPTNESYRDFIMKNYGEQEFKDLLVDGVNAVYYTTLAGGTGQSEPDYHAVVQFARNSKTYDFSLDSNKSLGPQEELIEKILSSLSFK